MATIEVKGNPMDLDTMLAVELGEMAEVVVDSPDSVLVTVENVREDKLREVLERNGLEVVDGGREQ